MKKLYIFLALSFFGSYLNAQYFQWAKREGLWAYDYGYGVITDDSGNVYLTGKYELEANFSGTILPDRGNHDIFLVKYNPDGALNWIRTAGGIWGDYAAAIDCDGHSFVYIAGEIEGDYLPVYFDGTDDSLTAIGSNDVFFAKYDLNGNIIWAKQAGWWLNEKALGITCDFSGNVFVCGLFNDTTIFSGNMIVGYGMNDIFIAKYDSSGNFQWIQKAGSAGRDEAKSVKCDSQGNVYITGLFSDTCNFNSQTIISQNGYYDIFLAKYDTHGNLNWVKQAGSNFDEVGWGLAVDDSDNIYVTGEFNADAYFDTVQLITSGNADAFVACYDTSGNLKWVKKAGGELIDRARGIGTDGKKIYLTGQFGSVAYFDSTIISASDSSDIFIAAIDSAGNFQWAVSVGGSSDSYEELGYESGNAIAAFSDGNVYATGALLDSGIFGNDTITTYSRTDVFINKISQLCSTEPPQPGNIIGASEICENSANNYSVSPVNGAISYQWNLPSGWSGNSNSNFINALSDSANGSIFVFAKNPCGNSLPSSLAVTVNQNPDVFITSEKDTICKGDTVNLFANGANFYLWKPGEISSDSIVVSPDSTMSVSVIGTDNNECKDTASITIAVEICMHTDEEFSDFPFLIFPNPNKNQFTIYNLQSTIYNIDIYDALGKNVYTNKIANRKSYIVNLNLPTGIYFLQIHSEQKIFNKKMIIH